jgi:hypothetical protein
VPLSQRRFYEVEDKPNFGDELNKFCADAIAQSFCGEMRVKQAEVSGAS